MPTSYPNNRMKTMMLLTYMNVLLKKICTMFRNVDRLNYGYGTYTIGHVAWAKNDSRLGSAYQKLLSGKLTSTN